MKEYLELLILLLGIRALDLFSTWLVTPDLRRETNPIYRRLGWYWSIVFNVVACLIVAAWPFGAAVVATLSLLAVGWNVSNSLSQ